MRGITRWVAAMGVLLLAGSLQAAKSAAPFRWTATTPDEMLDFALRRAAAGGDGALPGLAEAWSLSDRASAGRTRIGLEALGRGEDDIAAQARWLAAGLDPTPRATPPGLVRSWSLLGPFQDTGGELARRKNPEDPTQT